MKKSKVYYFKPVMNFIFSHPKSLIALIFYIIIEIVGVFFPIKEDITHYLDIIQLPANQFLVQFVLVLISVTLSGLFSHILRIKKYFLHQFIFFKQSLYNKLNYLYKTQDISKLKKITIQWIIVIFYHHEKIMFNSQEETIRSILQKMNARSSNKIFWIQGDAYSGKTTTILNLLIYLITFRDFSVLYEKLDGQILYFDLGNDDFQIKNLIDEHNQGKYENKLLLLDNFHKISEINCKDILSNILINLRAFAVIIAMRKPESFLAGPKYLKDLKTAISERGLLYKLDGIEKEFNTSSSDEFKVFLEEFGLSNDEMLNIPLSIHFLSLHSKERSDYKQFIPRIRSFIKGKAQWDAFDDMLLALVSASLFTGSFSLKTVKSLDIYSLTQWNKFLKYLLNLGFVISYPHSQKTYYFLHEKIAKFYLKKTFNIPLYKKKYLDYFNKLYLYYKNLENARFTFLYALLQNNSEIEETVFNKIITNINFLNFYEEINFLLQLDETKRKKFYRELGILCDRSGKLNESLNYYKEYLNVAQNDQCIDALYKIIQINHEYQSKYPAIEQNAATHKKPYYKLLHDYWQEHIKKLLFKQIRRVMLFLNNTHMMDYTF